MMVAGYQKFLSPTLGLTNYEQMNADIIKQYGGNGLVLDGHSRGSLTVDNAMGSTLNQSGTGSAAGLNVNFYGAAANAVRAGDKLTQLQGGTGDNTAQALKSTVHPQDQVGTFLGGNQQTQDGAENDGKGFFANIWNIMKGEFTSHNCYGTGPRECASYWNNLPISSASSVPPNQNGPAHPPTQPNIENQEQLNKLRGKINSMLPVNFTTKTSKTENTKQP